MEVGLNCFKTTLYVNLVK